MTKVPFMIGRAGEVESNGRKARAEQQRAMEDGLDEVSGAIQELMRWPEEERQSRLKRLADQLNTLAASTDSLGSKERLRRLDAADKLVELLRRVSVESSDA